MAKKKAPAKKRPAKKAAKKSVKKAAPKKAAKNGTKKAATKKAPATKKSAPKKKSPKKAKAKRAVKKKAATSQSLVEFMDIFRSYMRKRLCGIVFAKSRGDKKAEFEIGSGFVISAGEFFVLVTAGHILHKIAKLAKTNTLLGPSIIVPSGPRSVAELSLFSYELAAGRYWTEADFDIGFLIVSRDLQEHLETAGVVTVKRDYGYDVQRKAKRLVVGYCADGAHLHDQEVYHFVENNAVRTRCKTQLGAVPLRFVYLSASRTEDGVVYRATPGASETATVAGMSGGFVIDVFINEPIQNYEWVGVQSSQQTITKDGKDVVTEVAFISAKAVIAMADHFAQDFSAQLQRDNGDE